MGLLDTVICKYKLPLPGHLMELDKVDFSSRMYQTTSMENLCHEYTIREDGTLWREIYDVEYDPNAKGLQALFSYKRVNVRHEQLDKFTGGIVFYDLIYSDKYDYDYDVEFVAVFVDGKLVHIKLNKFDFESNKERIARHNELTEIMNAYEVFRKRWYMKYLYTPYSRCVIFMFKLWARFIAKLPPAHKVQKFFLPLG